MVIVLVILMISGNLSFGIAKAQAASINNNLDLTKKVTSVLTPINSFLNVNTESSALVTSPEGYLAKPLVTETQVTPERTVSRTQAAVSNIKTVAKPRAKLASTPGNHFAYGYCTWYVASRRNIPWFGNAGTWLIGAQGAGFATGNVPQVGAIIVTSESRWGHVGIVEGVNGDGTITISEMNYSGFARITSRTISVNYGAIKGYIY